MEANKPKSDEILDALGEAPWDIDEFKSFFERSQREAQTALANHPGSKLQDQFEHQMKGVRFLKESHNDLEVALDEYGGWTPRAAKTQAWWQLRRLLKNMTSKPNYDGYTRAHIEESRARIKKGLDAAFQVGGNSGGGIIILHGKSKGDDKE